MKDLEDPELNDLSSRLPHMIMHNCADSTVKKYCGAFRRWKTWAVAHKLLPIPARLHEFALYLQFIGERSGSKSAAEEACNALSWVHSISGLATHPLVNAMLSGIQRSLAKPVVKKEPMTIGMIEAVVRDAEQSGSLSDLRLATSCVLGYGGFFRFSELVDLTPADFAVNGEMMLIQIRHSKNGQLRQGDEVVIARDIMFFIKALKQPSNHFNIYDYVSFSTTNTRSSSNNKLNHVYTCNNYTRNFYFNRISRLWNKLPSIDLSQPLSVIKVNIYKYLHQHFTLHFSADNPCTYHFGCRCSNCYNVGYLAISR